MGLLPSKPNLVSDSDAGPRVVGVDSEDADALMSALTSRTARRLLSTLHEEPAPPSRLADHVDTSLQNVQYHLERLEDAGAVEVVGTAYSEKGREMDLYAPAAEPLVIYAGREEEASGLRAALSRLVSGVVALAVGAVAVQEVFGDGIPFPVAQMGSGGSADGGDLGGDGGDISGGSGGGGGGGGGGADVAGDAGSAGTPEPTPTSGGDGIGIAEAPTESPTPAAEPSAGTATPAPTEAAETMVGTPVPTAQSTGTPAPVATETPLATGTPSPMATEAATPVPTEAVTATATAEPTPVATATDVTTEVVRTVAGSGGAFEPAALPPGLLFFLGGVLVLVAGVALTYGR